MQSKMSAPVRNVLQGCCMNKLTQKSRYTASLLPKLFLSSRVNDKKTSSNLEKLQNGPSLSDFIKNDQNGELENSGNLEETVGHITEHPYIDHSVFHGEGRKVYFETYGCQMNVNDTEIVWSVLNNSGFTRTHSVKEADVVFLMTCSIREGAEKKIWSRVDQLQIQKRQRKKGQTPFKIGILGCMAERLKSQILEERKSVDLVCGPDAYKDLPRLLSITQSGQTAVNVALSLDETYADVMPIRMNPNSPSAFVSIMRGCDNMCSYCIVPFTRGRERSRPISSILDEVRTLSEQGIKEVTLLGQNVNSYRDLSEQTSMESPVKEPTNLAKGFKTIYRPKVGGLRFADLLERVSEISPEMRIRFTSPHPKDFPNEVLDLISERSNLCNQIHIPAQSGSTSVLEYMRRGYSRESYIELIQNIRERIPDMRLSSDFISGFCGETEKDHEDTMTLLDIVRYHRVFHFPYSLREKTHAHRRLKDDVPHDLKQRRHREVGVKVRQICAELNKRDVGSTQLVLIESDSRRSADDWMGRNDGNTKVIFPKTSIQCGIGGDNTKQIPQVGDYVAVKITDSTSETLRGQPLFISGIQDYHHYENNMSDQLRQQSHHM